MADEIDPNIRSNIEGVGNVETFNIPLVLMLILNLKTHTTQLRFIRSLSQGNEGNKDYHPYELEFHVDDDNNVELRCYYGTIYYL